MTAMAALLNVKYGITYCSLKVMPTNSDNVKGRRLLCFVFIGLKAAVRRHQKVLSAKGPYVYVPEV